MNESFTAEFFSGNRARLRELFTGTAPIVLSANGQVQKVGDDTLDFCQDSSFWYLTGIDNPDVILVLDKDKEYLILPHREAAIEVFDGAIDPEALRRSSGIQTIMNEKDGWKQLKSRLKKVKHVATLAALPAYIDYYGMYSNPARHRLVKRIKACNSRLEILDLREHLARLRMVKQPLEIAAIEAAITITIDSLKDALRPSKRARYAYEYELEAEISYGFRKRGAKAQAFHPIVAGGIQATTIHNIENQAALKPRDFVIVDVGAEVCQYDADISRTVCLSGRPTKRQQAVFMAVREVQDFALSLLKPGALLRDNEKQVELFMGEKLRELGLIKTIEHETVRTYFPHATSHFLGLDTHDVGDYERPLEPGVVLVAEPGIYIPEEAIGVRIEDDFLITETGHRNLSARLPRDF